MRPRQQGLEEPQGGTDLRNRQRARRTQGAEEGVVEDDSQVILLVTEWNVCHGCERRPGRGAGFVGGQEMQAEMYPVSEVKILAG